MKKILFATVAMAAAIVMGGAVESENIVGYGTASSGEFESTAYGCTFVPVGATAEQTTFRLGDVKVEGLDIFNGEFIQILDPDTTATDVYLVYIDAAASEALTEVEGDTSLVGWWDLNDIGGTSYDDYTMKIGWGFLAAFSGDHEVKFQCAGEVEKNVRDVDVSGCESPLFVNPLPTTVKLGQVTMTGLDVFNGEFVQILNKNTTATEDYLVYIDAATSEALTEVEGDTSLVGWWDLNDIGGTSYDDRDVAPGEGFLGAFSGDGHDVIVSWPSVHPDAE